MPQMIIFKLCLLFTCSYPIFHIDPSRLIWYLGISLFAHICSLLYSVHFCLYKLWYMKDNYSQYISFSVFKCYPRKPEFITLSWSNWRTRWYCGTKGKAPGGKWMAISRALWAVKRKTPYKLTRNLIIFIYNIQPPCFKIWRAKHVLYERTWPGKE